MIGITRYFPGGYTETVCINCRAVFAYRTKHRKLTTCSPECSENARHHLSGEKRKVLGIEAVEQHGSV